MILKTGDLTELGGKCAWCHAEDKWEIQHTDVVHFQRSYSETIVYLKCVGLVEYVNAPGEREKCGNTKQITLDTSKEYDPDLEKDVET